METKKRKYVYHYKNSFGQYITQDLGEENTDYCVTKEEFSTKGTLPDSLYYAAEMTPFLFNLIRPSVPAWDDMADWKYVEFSVIDGIPAKFRPIEGHDFYSAVSRVEIKD